MSNTARPIVIIEGPDCAGKTTLAEAICAATGAAYRHEGPPPATTLDLAAYYGQRIMLAEHAGGNVVFDRLALGELVYGPVARGASRITHEDFAMFERLRKVAGARHVVCLPSFETCRKAWAPRARAGQEYITDPARFADVWDGFYKLAHRYKLELYDRDVEPLAQAVTRFTTPRAEGEAA